jgi:hypothetical protein
MKKLTKKPARSIEDRIQPLSEVDRNVAVLCYGDQKTGKTVFGCSFPKPLLLIDIMERGTDSVIDVADVDVVHAGSTGDMEDLYWHLEGKTRYKSVVLDQMTGLQNLVIREMKEKRNQRSDDVFSQRAYGQLGGWMTQWILNYSLLVDHGYNVCFLSHQKRIEAQEEDDDRLAPEVTTALTGSITNFLLGAVSVIGNQFIRESYDKKTKETEMQYCMRLVSGFYRCGIRRPVSAGPVPEYVVNPTYDKIMKLSKGESLARKVKKL